MVTLERGDILVGRDLTGGVYTGITLEVWRDGTFLGTLENSIDYGWNVDAIFPGVTYRIGTDHEGNVYTGAASSNNSNSCPNIYKWDSEGRWLGGPFSNIWSPWGNDVGVVCVGLPCPAGTFGAGLMTNIIGMLPDRFGYIYVLRANQIRGDVVGDLFVGDGQPVDAVYGLAKYSPDGTPVQKFRMGFDWLTNPGSGINNQDYESGDITCDGKTCVVVCGQDHALGVATYGQILRYDLTQTNPIAEVLYQPANLSGGGDFTGQSTAIHPSTGEIICLHSAHGPIIKISPSGAVELVEISNVITQSLALDYWLDPRHCIVDNNGSVYMVDLTKPDGASDIWQAKAIDLVFDTPNGTTRALGVYNKRDCLDTGSGVFGTVIGAT